MHIDNEEKPGVDSTGKGRVVPAGGRGEVATPNLLRSPCRSDPEGVGCRVATLIEESHWPMSPRSANGCICNGRVQPPIPGSHALGERLTGLGVPDVCRVSPLIEKKDPDPKAGESPAPKGKDDAEQGEGFTDSVTGERITLAVLLAAWE